MDKQQIEQAVKSQLEEWLNKCTRRERLARNTIAAGIVVLHHLRNAEALPLRREDVFSNGGELKHSRGQKLGKILNMYGLPENYLKEVTTRQAHQDAQQLMEKLAWGAILKPLQRDERDSLLQQMIEILKDRARKWLEKDAIKIRLSWNESPQEWLRQILSASRERSKGIVEQHLVGAKLQMRFPHLELPVVSAYAADTQTGRQGDFELVMASETLILHVTANPTLALIEKCKENLRQSQRPVIITTKEKENHALALAETEGIAHQISVIPIEHYITTNLIEMAAQQQVSLKEIIIFLLQIYNQRVDKAETDRSCKLELE